MTEANKLDSINSKLDTLIEQVGRLTEGLIDIRLTIQQQNEVAQRQERNIDRLLSIVEQLISK